jgi:hypothetical protein
MSEIHAVHELKCWPEPFNAILRGEKRYEVRKDDRGFEVGDRLRLRAWDPSTGAYLGSDLFARVTYLSRGPDWGLPEGLVIMSIESVAAEGAMRRELLALRRRVMNHRRELRRLNRALAAAQKSETAARIAALRGRAKGEVYYDVSSAYPKSMLLESAPSGAELPKTCGETCWGVLRPASPDLPVRRCVREPMHTSQVKHTDGEVFW